MPGLALFEKNMRRTLLALLAGLIAGAVTCYLTMDWRIGAAQATASLYQLSAIQSYEARLACEGSQAGNWPKRRP